MTEKNVIYIVGNTYLHRKELFSIAEFDSALKVFIAPISKKEEVKDLCSKLNLKCEEHYDESYTEPRNERDRELRRTESFIKLKRVKLLECHSKIDDIRDNGNPENNKSEIEDIKTFISELNDGIKSLEEKKIELQKEDRRGLPKKLVLRTLKERANDGEDWLRTNPPRMKRILNKKDGSTFLPRSIVALLVGSGGVGKSRLIMQIIYSIAAGIPFLGMFDVDKESRRGRVFYGTGEEDDHNMWRRLKSIQNLYHPVCDDFTKPTPNLKSDINNLENRTILQSFRGLKTRLTDEKGNDTPEYSELLNALKLQEGEHGFDLIVLDPISRFQGITSEIDNNAATDFVSALERMSKEFKGSPTILICHHMVKNGELTNQDASRGSSGLSSGVRWQVNVATPKTEGDQKTPSSKVPAKGLLALELVKHNDVRPLDHPILLKFNEHGVLIPAEEQDCIDKGVKAETFFPSKSDQNNSRQATKRKDPIADSVEKAMCGG